MSFWRLFGQACRLWGRHWGSIVLFNILWFLLQLPIVTGPPATAAFFAMSKRMVDDEIWELRDIWQELRRLFWPAWRWALPSGLLAFVLYANLYIFWGVNEGVFPALRVAWFTLALLWLALNLLFWPFWLSQREKSVRVAAMNGLRFFARHPLQAAALALVAGLMVAVSAILLLPIPFGMVGLIMLLSALLVQASLDD